METTALDAMDQATVKRAAEVLRQYYAEMGSQNVAVHIQAAGRLAVTTDHLLDVIERLSRP